MSKGRPLSIAFLYPRIIRITEAAIVNERAVFVGLRERRRPWGLDNWRQAVPTLDIAHGRLNIRWLQQAIGCCAKIEMF